MSPSKLPRKASVLDTYRWGLGQVKGFCSILVLASVPTSAVIGAFMGGADEILVALAISAAFILLFGSIALAFVAMGSIADFLRGLLRRVGRRSPRGPQGGGVADEWLDGPC